MKNIYSEKEKRVAAIVETPTLRDVQSSDKSGSKEATILQMRQQKSQSKHSAQQGMMRMIKKFKLLGFCCKIRFELPNDFCNLLHQRLCVQPTKRHHPNLR